MNMRYDVNLRSLVSIVVAALLILLVGSLGLVGWGYFVTVGENEGAIITTRGRIERVVGAGFYWSLNPFKSAIKWDRSAMHFEVTDPEVLTKSAEQENGEIASIGQSIGIVIAGDVFRPGPEDAVFIKDKWRDYRPLFLNDELIIGDLGLMRDPNTAVGAGEGLVQQLAKQAAKECVGERTFDNAVVGTARGELRQCIQDKLGALAEGYGLTVANVTVPDVILDEQQQEIVAQLGQAKFMANRAEQQEQQAIAEAERDAATERGKIKIEQARVQEKARQDKITAQLRKQALEAQKAAIEAEKANERFKAEKDLEISRIKRDVAEQEAKAQLALELAKAQMYGDNAKYVELLVNQAWAEAWNQVDKVIVPQGVNPTMILGGGTMPTFDVGQQTAGPR
ncbi:MAG: hypothetical protein MAG451_03069 [Anaerolineales bacterium]|nr:hypothetical protein [Anaerolineales bacterium]